MIEREWNAQDIWQPSPGMVLSNCYHPSMSDDHPFFHKLPAKEKKLVIDLHHQYERWSHTLYFKHGLADRLIAALNGYDWAGKIADCMMIRNPYVPEIPFNRCKQDWFCEFCAYLKGQDILKKYANSWKPDGWYEMVLTLKVGVCLSHPDHDDMNDVWNAIVAAVKRLKEEKQMLGYVGWHEIKIQQFWPDLFCAPHTHVLLRCDTEPDREVFARIIAQEWMRGKLTAKPDLFLERVKSEAHFYEILSYVKPIDLFGPYDRNYQAAKAVGKVELLHQEVREFFNSLANETTHFQNRWDKRLRRQRLMLVTRKRFLYGGNCHGSSRHPLGLKEAVRRTQEHQEVIRMKVEIAREAEEHQVV